MEQTTLLGTGTFSGSMRLRHSNFDDWYLIFTSLNTSIGMISIGIEGWSESKAFGMNSF